MGKIIIGVIIGLIVGAAGTFFLFVGVPRAAQIPGQPIQPPDSTTPAGAAQIVLHQEFFNEVLRTIFRDMAPPAFPIDLAVNSNGERVFVPQYAAFQEPPKCDGKLTVLPEGSGVTTGVRFENNRISAPLAFSGSYSSPFGCIDFKGWAQANLELRFDAEQRSVIGRINVETVNLDGVNPLVSGFVTPIVQTTLNNRVNPIQILQGKQLGVDVPIASAGGRLKADVKDVRAEFKDDALNLSVVYDFSGGAMQ
jgi:hypothetical protein